MNEHVRLAVGKGRHALVDVADLPLLAPYRWACWCSGTETKVWYVRGWLDGRTEHMHRVIMDPSSGLEVDHINHDGLDNRRCNLRVVPHRLNHGATQRGRSSRFRGVGWHRRVGKWSVKIQIDGIRYQIGCFTDEKEAARAYDAAALDAWGEYAKLNFPVEGAA